MTLLQLLTVPTVWMATSWSGAHAGGHLVRAPGGLLCSISSGDWSGLLIERLSRCCESSVAKDWVCRRDSVLDSDALLVDLVSDRSVVVWRSCAGATKFARDRKDLVADRAEVIVHIRTRITDRI